MPPKTVLENLSELITSFMFLASALKHWLDRELGGLKQLSLDKST